MNVLQLVVQLDWNLANSLGFIQKFPHETIYRSVLDKVRGVVDVFVTGIVS